MKLKGMDVSDHTPIKDGVKAKNDGIEFVMIRIGYGGDNEKQDDDALFRNLEECKKAGLPFGLYFYSYALNMDSVKGEIKHARRLLKEIRERGYEPEFPVAYDMEDADGYKQRHGMPKGEELVDFCYEWLNAIESDGYYVSLYASKSWLNGRLKSKKLDRFDKWVAQWNDECTYKGNYKMWQYTNKGTVDGVGSGIDLDIAYSDFRMTSDPQENDQSQMIHVVRPGETLSGIAEHYGTDIQTLMNLNSIIDNADLINVGWRLKVPEKQNEKYGTYRIKSGDNLYGIAKKFDTSIARIMRLNPHIERQDLIYAGDEIKVPK